MKNQQGFTLIELAIVLVIVTILVGGLAMPLSAQIQARRIAETNRTLEEAREAIIGYAMSHTVSPPITCTCEYLADTTLDPDSTCPVQLCPTSGTTTLNLLIARHYLPCPDLNGADPEPNLDNDGVDGLTDLNNGAEDRMPGVASGDPYVPGATCAAPAGNLPWVTLATAAQDAWGNRLHYAVTVAYANMTTGFGNVPSGNKQICDTSAGTCAGNVAMNVPVVLISYGANGWGARNVNGSTLQLPTSDDELENISTSPGLDPDAYITHPPNNVPATEFDDMVVWLSHSLLISRVCPSGGCP